MPQNEAGMRIEPPASVPTASGQIPAKSAAALPPLLPPGVRSRFHGLRVTPAKRRVGQRLPAEFGRRRLAEQHRAMRPQPGRDRRILVPFLVRVDRLRADEARPAAGQHRVLDRHRHAVEQALRLALAPARLRGARHRHRRLRVVQHKSVDRALIAFEPAQGFGQHLDRRQLLARGRARPAGSPT